MSEFLRATFNAINRHGSTVNFIRVGVPVYNRFAGTAASSETTISLKSYPRHVAATQYNMPNMIGKEIIEFYFYAPDLLGVAPKINDRIAFNSTDYTAFMIREHRALGAVVLYKVMSVKT